MHVRIYGLERRVSAFNVGNDHIKEIGEVQAGEEGPIHANLGVCARVAE